jgi:hypothetical protein
MTEATLIVAWVRGLAIDDRSTACQAGGAGGIVWLYRCLLSRLLDIARHFSLE